MDGDRYYETIHLVVLEDGTIDSFQGEVSHF